MKTCSKCGEAKELSEFSKNGRSKNGEQRLYPRCKECKSAQDKKYREDNGEHVRELEKRSSDANRDKRNARQRDYVKRNYKKVKADQKRYRDENREEMRKKQQEYFYKNRESCNERSRAYNCKNKEKISEQKAEYYLGNEEWRQANSEKLASYRRKRRAIKNKAFVEDISRSQLRERDGDDCCYCGCELDFDPVSHGEYRPKAAQVEHIKPLSRGGLHEPGNLALACAACNYEKGSKTLDEYLAWLEFRFTQTIPSQRKVIP